MRLQFILKIICKIVSMYKYRFFLNICGNNFTLEKISNVILEYKILSDFHPTILSFITIHTYEGEFKIHFYVSLYT